MEELTLEEKLWRIFHVQVFYFCINANTVAGEPMNLIVMISFFLVLPFILRIAVEGIVAIYELAYGLASAVGDMIDFLKNK